MQIWISQVLEKAGVSKNMKLGNNLYTQNNVAASATCMKRKRQARKAAISNEELIQLVRPFLSETRLFSTRHKRPILRFTTSIKNVYLATPELRRRMRYCHFARRLDLKHCRLGLGVARQRDDLCPAFCR